MSTSDPREELLVERARRGDAAARAELLARHRERLRQMIAVRMDRRLLARIDPSDVVQDALVDAHSRLSEYLQECRIPFYPWLRQLALERLIDLHRRQIQAGRRSVAREETRSQGLPDESALDLANRLVASGTSPSGRLVREELCVRVRQALLQLPPRDHEVLVLRHLEQLSMAEIAAILGITEGAAKVRHVRALERIRTVLEQRNPEGRP
jgi:RNA polymerase sigma-70 factor (ECF subfamily)